MVIMLKRKMFRDIKNNLSQFITIFLMIMIGMLVYSGIEAYMTGMETIASNFYSQNNLQDLNVIGPNFTTADLKAIKSIANVLDAERKLSVTGSTNQGKTLLINFLETNNISKFYVINGEPFNANKSGVWLDNAYASLNNIQVGDTVLVSYEELNLEEKVLGLINVPDHVYDVKDETEIFPKRAEFGFAYLSINEIPKNYIKSKVMKEMNITDDLTFTNIFPNFNYKDYLIFNSVMVDVDNKTNNDAVKEQINTKVKNASAVINIEDTMSYEIYQGEIDEGKTFVGVFSSIFLFIALISVLTTMTRIIKKERVQIGTLKALGFSNIRILFHYIGYILLISIIAVIIGLTLGYYILGNIYISIEMNIFEIPNGHPIMNPKSYLVAFIVILIVLLITYFTGQSILKENPAETLKPKPPKFKKRLLNITTKGIFKKFSFASIWNLRDITRNKLRTFMALAGITGCTVLIICALGMLDSMNHFIDLQYNTLNNFKYKLTLAENLTLNELQELEILYGNKTSKTYGIEIKDNTKKEANNLFVTAASKHIRFIDKEEKNLTINSLDGIYITSKLAETKNYKLGDTITWRIYGSDNYYTSKIVGFNKDFQNQNITITKEYLESLGITYKPDTIYTNKDLKGIKEIKNVAIIQNKATLKNGMNNMVSMMKTMLILLIGIAVILNSVIIYNFGILSYTEKEYQFATLKVLGFTSKQIKNIFIKQNNWLTIISVIIGLPLGFYLTTWIFKNVGTDQFDFTANITLKTYLISSFGIYLISYLISNFLAKRITHIDMVSSLKGNE